MIIDQEKIDKIKREKEMTQVKSNISVVEEQCAILAYELMMMSVKNPETDSAPAALSKARSSMWFILIDSFYKNKLWDKNMVKEAVEFGKLTEIEYEEITGDKYIV